MTFTVNDYHDLIRLLREHPDWRFQLRKLLLSDDFLALPEIVRSLAAAQQRTEQRLEELAAAQQRTEQRLEELAAAQQRTEQRLEELVAAQQRTEQRLQALSEQVQVLAIGQQHIEQRLETTEQRLETTEQRLENLVNSHERLVDTVGNMKGKMLELTYSDKAGAYLGRLLRRVKVIPVHTLEDTLETHLSPAEFNDVLLLDLLVRGTPRYHPELSEIWLAVEISSVIDRKDVNRVLRRTELLRKAGYQVIPVVAGEETTQGTQEAASTNAVVVLQNGTIDLWPEALQTWVAA